MIVHDDWFTTNIRDLRYNFNSITCTIKDGGSFKKSSLKEAVAVACEEIKSKYKNIYMAHSGGMDSAFVFKSLCDNNVDFTVASVICPWTTDETRNLGEICKKAGKKYLPIGLTIDGLKKYRDLISEKNKFPVVDYWQTFFHLIILENIPKDSILIYTGDIMPSIIPRALKYGKFTYRTNLRALYTAGLYDGTENVLPFTSYSKQIIYELRRSAELYVDKSKYSLYHIFEEAVERQIIKSHVYQIPLQHKVRSKIFPEDSGFVYSISSFYTRDTEPVYMDYYWFEDKIEPCLID